MYSADNRKPRLLPWARPFAYSWAPLFAAIVCRTPLKRHDQQGPIPPPPPPLDLHSAVSRAEPTASAIHIDINLYRLEMYILHTLFTLAVVLIRYRRLAEPPPPPAPYPSTGSPAVHARVSRGRENPRHKQKPPTIQYMRRKIPFIYGPFAAGERLSSESSSSSKEIRTESGSQQWRR